MSERNVKIELACSGLQYGHVSKEWKEWRRKHFGKMVSKYPFFKWKANGMTIECDYVRDSGPDGKEYTKEFKITYQGPEGTEELAQIREWFEPPKPKASDAIKEIKARWNYKISLEEQRGCP